MTYRYLRIAIAGTVVALITAVAIESFRVGVLNSISAYYYTDARNIFVSSLIACALGMLALSEPGPQRTLRAVGALFAPLVALIPTTTHSGSVPGIEFDCPDGSNLCVPESYRAEVAVGIGTYLVVAVIAWVVALVYQLLRPKGRHSAMPTLIVAGAVILTVAGADLLAHNWLVRVGHGLSALIFFGIFSTLAVLNAIRPGPVSQAIRVVYVIVAAGMVVAVIAVLVAGLVSAETEKSIPILVPEVAELGLFFTFWILQTVDGARRSVTTG